MKEDVIIMSGVMHISYAMHGFTLSWIALDSGFIQWFNDKFF